MPPKPIVPSDAETLLPEPFVPEFMHPPVIELPVELLPVALVVPDEPVIEMRLLPRLLASELDVPLDVPVEEPVVEPAHMPEPDEEEPLLVLDVVLVDWRTDRELAPAEDRVRPLELLRTEE